MKVKCIKSGNGIIKGEVYELLPTFIYVENREGYYVIENGRFIAWVDKELFSNFFKEIK